MPETLPMTPQATVVWDKINIVEKGIPFLTKKKDELKIYQDLWDATKQTNFCSNESKEAVENYKRVAEISRKEIEVLNNAVTQFLKAECVIDPTSEQTKQLSKIALAAQHSLNFYASVIQGTNDSDNFKNLNQRMWQFGGVTTMLRFAAYLFDYNLPAYATTTWKISIIAPLSFEILLYLYQSGTEKKVNELKELFEKALSEAVTNSHLTCFRAIPATPNTMKLNSNSPII